MKTNNKLKIDTHIHLTGTGCCNSGCWVSEDFKKRYTFQAIKWLQNITQQQMETTIDSDWGQKISSYISDSELDYGVVLGFDGVYHQETGKIDSQRSQMIIPPEWVFKLCHKHKNLLPGPSLNPFKIDSLKELEYCIANKAVLIKWIPTAQDIDPSSLEIKNFYQMMVKNNIPLLVHTGGEKTFKEVSPELNDLTLLEMPIEMGVKVIFAHCATHTISFSEPNHQEKQKELLELNKNLFVDNSGLCNPSRFFHLPKLFSDPLLVSRMIYGSDWPVPSNSFYYPALGLSKIMELEKIKNPIQRDIEIKRSLGMSDEPLFMAQKVLSNIDYWDKNANTESLKSHR